MAKQPTKAANNMYCKARMEASKWNPSLSSREGASEYTGISKDSIAEYELDLCKVVPVDKVVIMADAYNAPQLLHEYCHKDCPIGNRIAEPLDMDNVDNLYKFTVMVSNDLEYSQEIQKILMKIVADGVITEDEKPELQQVIDFLSSLARRATELKVHAEKYLK